MHGYEIHQTLLESNALGLVWRVKQGQLYSLLARLEGEGLIRASTESQGARPPRKMLEVTDRGREAYHRWVIEPVQHPREVRLLFLAKLFCAHRLGPGYVSELVRRQEQEFRGQLDGLSRQMEEHSQSAFDELVYEYRIGQVEATLRWLSRCLDALARDPAGARS